VGVQRWACAGDYGASGPGEEGVRVFLLQPTSAGHLVGGVVACALGLLLGKGGMGVGWWFGVEDGVVMFWWGLFLGG